MRNSLLGCAALLLFSAVTLAAPTVSNMTISWPDDGWYQVQDEATHTEVCAGGRSCIVAPGVYVVINHSTGERFNDIEVAESRTDDLSIDVNGNVISWPDDGWYQVQDEATHSEVCAGGRSCSVLPGTYVVINHSTNERFNGIEIVEAGTIDLTISVSANVISWPDDGWYQVQNEATHMEVCAGGRSCAVEPGIYVVINHSTGDRFNGIEVRENAIQHVQASLELVADKTFRISWLPSEGVEFYRVLENPDGVSGFSQIRTDLDASVRVIDHRVALYARVNARYMVQACNARGCVDSEELFVSGTLESAIGYFTASNNNLGDIFGTEVSLSANGNTLAVGAWGEASASLGINGNQNDNSASNSGAVYIFARAEGGWRQQAYVKASNTDSGDIFGATLSLNADGNTLAVGAYGESSAATGINGNQDDNSANGSGAVYIFARIGRDWQQQAYVKASNTNSSDFFGVALSLSGAGNTLAVGATGEASSSRIIDAHQDDNSFNTSGAVYVFTRVSGNWQQQAYLKSSNNDGRDFFGVSVSLSAEGNTLAVGALGEDSVSTGIDGDQGDDSVFASGAVYLFDRVNGNWRQKNYLKAHNTDQSDRFGGSVSLSADGDTLAVGAIGEDSASTGINGNHNDNSAEDSGAVYLFLRSDGTWQQQAYLKASNNDANDWFGRPVSLSADGNMLAVGAVSEDSTSTGINGDQEDNSAYDGAGAVYVFKRSGGLWQQQAYVKARNDSLGRSANLSADGDTLAVGAVSDSLIPGSSVDNRTNSGADAVFLY